jgi:hypothetical protein
MKINWHSSKFNDIWDEIENPELDRGSFDNYLETLVNFLENERKKYEQNINSVSEEIQDASEGMPYELQRAYHELEYVFPEFENTLFSSFFVAIYFYLESELTRYCRILEKENPEMLLLSDLAGAGIVKSMIYLVKVQRIEYSLNSPEWEKIQKYGVLRNCIVHNQGKVDEVLNDDQRKKLLEFIKRKNSKLKLEDTRCILDKDFCLDALNTIEKFLYSVSDAHKPKTQ